jgi:hypothetical protein
MEVNPCTTSPDFAAGEAQFFRKLRAAFLDLQTQCENEKVSNQRSFERDQQATQQHIRDLEAKCYDLEKTRREAEDAYKKAALELQKKKDEETQGRVAHHESEEKRRRKYSALLAGSSSTNLRIVVVCLFAMDGREKSSNAHALAKLYQAPHHRQNVHQFPVGETAEMLDSGPNALPSRDGQRSIRNGPILSHGKYSLSMTLDTSMTEKAEHRPVEAERGATFSLGQNSAEEQVSHEESSEVGREINVAHVSVCSSDLSVVTLLFLSKPNSIFYLRL